MGSGMNFALLNTNQPAQIADSFVQGQANALARAAAQQDSELKSYALAKAQRADQTQSNYLAALAAAGNDHEKIRAATIASGDVKGAYALDKDRADADLNRQKSASYKLDAMGQVAGAILNNPTPENYSYHMDNMVTLGILTPEQATQQKLIVSQDPSKVTQLATQMRQAGLSAKDQLAKFQIVENGGSTLGLSTDPVSNQTTQTFSIQKTQSPDSIAADGRAEEKLQLQQNPLGLSGYGTPQRPPSSSPSAFIGGVDPSAVIRFESNGNQSAVSPKGATGAMQLMPNTAKGLGVNANDQLENTAGGVAYLSQLRKKYGDDRLALAAYNWGPGNVDNWLKAGADPAKLPAKTRNYVNNVLSLSGKNAQQAPAATRSTQPVSTQVNDSGVQVGTQPPQSGLTVKDAIDQNIHGQEFLATLPNDIAAKVKSISEGKMSLPAGGFAGKNPAVQQLISLVAQYDPEFDAVDYNKRNRTAIGFNSGKQGDAVRSVNQTLYHAGEVEKAINALDNFNGVATPLNYIANPVEKFLGDTRQGVFQQKVQALSSELRKVFSGSGGGSLSELQSWENSFPVNASKDQQLAYLKSGIALLGGAMSALDNQYQQGMGSKSSVRKLISPEANKVYDRLIGVNHNDEPANTRATTKAGATVSNW